MLADAVHAAGLATIVVGPWPVEHYGGTGVQYARHSPATLACHRNHAQRDAHCNRARNRNGSGNINSTILNSRHRCVLCSCRWRKTHRTVRSTVRGGPTTLTPRDGWTRKDPSTTGVSAAAWPAASRGITCPFARPRRSRSPNPRYPPSSSGENGLVFHVFWYRCMILSPVSLLYSGIWSRRSTISYLGRAAARLWRPRPGRVPTKSQLRRGHSRIRRSSRRSVGATPGTSRVCRCLTAAGRL